jgi:hypothetical protein
MLAGQSVEAPPRKDPAAAFLAGQGLAARQAKAYSIAQLAWHRLAWKHQRTILEILDRKFVCLRSGLRGLHAGKSGRPNGPPGRPYV